MIEADTVFDGADLVDTKWYVRRRMDELLMQIKQDHADLSRFWQSLRNRELDSAKVEELEGIGGLMEAEMGDIEKDVDEKKRELRVRMFSHLFDRRRS